MLLELEIRNRDGESLGEVEEVLVDLLEARAEFVVFGVGGFLGIGEKEIAVPFADLGWDVDERELILATTRDKIESAPDFDLTAFLGAEGKTRREEAREYWGD